jgi:glycosyltransferase involved in cell wall biosynthesis
MRIAFLSPFYPYRGGIAQFSDSLYVELSKSNEVKAFTFRRQYPSLFFPGKSQFVLKDDLDRGVKAQRTLDSINPLSFGKTAHLISEYKPELFLLSFWMPFFSPAFGRTAGIVKRKNRGTKIISILHNVLPHEKRAGDVALTKYFLNRCTGFVVLNKKSEYDLLELKPDAKYIVHPHPLYDHYGSKIDKREARANLGIPQEKKVILFFGLIRDYKGLDILIEAMKELDDSYLLMIAGEVYGSFDKYNEIIVRHHLRSRIKTNHQYIPDDMVAVYFSAADVCVLPYRSGTQSGIIGIAYHFGVPVIVTNVGGLKEMVENKKTGLVVPRPDYLLLSDIIAEFIEREDKEAYRKNIEEFKQKHSWKNFADDLIGFYSRL